MRLSLVAAALVLAGTTALTPVMVLAQTGAATSTTPATTAPAPATPMGAAPTTSTATSTPAGAQTPAAAVNTTPQSTNSASPSAVQTNSTTHRTAAAPVPGRNSFTMNQAARRISADGYTKVMGLKKDNQGIWRGQAQKDGNPVSVSLDYQGNVTGQ